MQHSRVLLHENGPALWPEHRSNVAVRKLKGTTISGVWFGTYQGLPTAPQGTIFRREWWRDKNRYDPTSAAVSSEVVARWMSWDTAKKDNESADNSACVTGELLSDYRLIIRHVYAEKLEFPDLPEAIETMARRFNHDGKLRGVIIEDKASGTSAYQTLVKASEAWLADILIDFLPTGDKTARAEQGAVWCRNGSVLLPHPDSSVPWLMDIEDELFNFPGWVTDDRVDALSQLLIYTENLLAEGYHARSKYMAEDT